MDFVKLVPTLDEGKPVFVQCRDRAHAQRLRRNALGALRRYFPDRTHTVKTKISDEGVRIVVRQRPLPLDVVVSDE